MSPTDVLASTILVRSLFSSRAKKKRGKKLLIYILIFSFFWWLLRVPTVSVFFRKGNYEALRRAQEKTDRTIGNLLKKLVRDYLQDLVAKEEKSALRSSLRRGYS